MYLALGILLPIVITIAMVHFDFLPFKKLHGRCLWIKEAGLTLIPESERSLARVVIGLNQISSDNSVLPKVGEREGLDFQQLREVKKRMYWLELELSHGHILDNLPLDSILYVAVPVGKDRKESQSEREWFEEYLRSRWHWDENALRHRIRFFDTPSEEIWTQDIAEVLGRDAKNRTVLALGQSEPDRYKSVALALAKAYPLDFTVHEIGNKVSTEGGDLELVWGPDCRPEVLAGRYAALRCLERSSDSFTAHESVASAKIKKVTAAYRQQFLELPVTFLPEAVLENPSLGTPEIFHLDMLASVFAGDTRPRAFVPILLEDTIDAATAAPLEQSFKESLERMYDLTTNELSQAGFEVIRLPFNDHPVRSPVNLVKYFDPSRNRYVVLLAKYPNHIQQDGIVCASESIRQSLFDLKSRFESWWSVPGSETYTALMEYFDYVGNLMADAASENNPIFNRQKEIIEQCGYVVIPVPMFPWGSGGLHCEILY